MLLAVLLGIAATVLFAQGNETPAAVKSKFSSLYPKATSVKWEKENGNYEAEFKLNNVETSVLLDAKGNVIEKETQMEVTALPKMINDYVTKNYPGEKIKEASKIEDSKNNVTYEAEVNNVDLLFDAKGNFVKKEAEEENEAGEENDND